MKQPDAETMYIVPPTFSSLLYHDDSSYKQLDDIFKSTDSIVDNHFFGDLEETVFAKSSNWHKVRHHEVVNDTIPLPLTNSPMEK